MRSICFNTQPPEGGCLQFQMLTMTRPGVSTHSHPKAAAIIPLSSQTVQLLVSTHSHPKAAAILPASFSISTTGFQHTATRRRLPPQNHPQILNRGFQHTATRRRLPKTTFSSRKSGAGFNTQPPEGGCPESVLHDSSLRISFNTQPPEGGCHVLSSRLVKTY